MITKKRRNRVRKRKGITLLNKRKRSKLFPKKEESNA